MCGICGQYNFQSHEPVHSENLKRMTDSIIHRGPDDEGFYLAGELGFEALQMPTHDIGYSVCAGSKGFPTRLPVDSDGSQHSHTGNYHFTRGQGSTSRIHGPGFQSNQYQNHIPGSTTASGWNRATCPVPETKFPARIWISVSRGATPDSQSHPGPCAAFPDPLRGS